MKFQVGYFSKEERNKRVITKVCNSRKEANNLEEELKNQGLKTFKRKRKLGVEDGIIT